MTHGRVAPKPRGSSTERPDSEVGRRYSQRTMRTRLFFAAAVLVALSIVNAGMASANEYSCANAAAANGYVNENKFLAEVQQDCAVAYGIAYADGVGTQSEASAAVAAAEQYLRSRGYDAATVAQMDIAGHGV